MEVIVARGLASCHKEAPKLTLYTLTGFIKVFISGTSSLLQLLLFLLPSSEEVNQSWRWYRRACSISALQPTPIRQLYRWKHTQPCRRVCMHTHAAASNTHDPTSDRGIPQCGHFLPQPTHQQTASKHTSRHVFVIKGETQNDLTTVYTWSMAKIESLYTAFN